MEYKTQGTCSEKITVVLNSDHTIREVGFTGGCAANTQAVAILATGKTAEEVIERVEGIPCGDRGTSCPDQLAKALRMALQEL